MAHAEPVRRGVVPLAAACLIALTAGLAAPAGASGPRVLLVGSYHGVAGQYATIQSAVDAAQPGDWILVGPGDYHENGVADPEPAGVLITTPGVHLRGMNRNTVIVDGTLPTAAAACSSAPQDQSTGPRVPGGGEGWDGVMAFEVSGVSIENLTVCNFLTGPNGGEGNQIWWNGGDGSGLIGMHEYHGAYLSATSTYSNGFDEPFGDYGIFVSNADGPGLIEHTYASNMGDSAYYIGACPDCNAVLSDAHGQNSALGYSGTNSGGHLVIQDSEFDHNKTGLTANSQNNDDLPSPQEGACPNGEPGPFGTGSCTVFEHNSFHDNNTPNVPGAGGGLAGSAPVGTGVVLAGTRDIVLYRNTFARNGSWGVLVADLPDQETPPPGASCQGGIPMPGDLCYYQAFGNQVLSNTFRGNGFFDNPSNGDIGLATTPHDPGNCFLNNLDPNGLTSDPPFIQSFPYNPCGTPNGGDMGPLAAEALCATQLVFPCPNLPEATYPRPQTVVLKPLPKRLPTMPDPCAGVPANPWCPAARGRA